MKVLVCWEVLSSRGVIAGHGVYGPVQTLTQAVLEQVHEEILKKSRHHAAAEGSEIIGNVIFRSVTRLDE